MCLCFEQEQYSDSRLMHDIRYYLFSKSQTDYYIKFFPCLKARDNFYFIIYLKSTKAQFKLYFAHSQISTCVRSTHVEG